MPNWVFNSISVQGNTEEVTAFLEHAKKPSPFTPGEDREFNFHSFVTPPEDKVEQYNTIAGYRDGVYQGDPEFNWYKWNNENWDTKWNACEVVVDRGIGLYSLIQFNTAWSPPTPVFKAMAEMFPSITFDVEYEEEQGWGGSIKFVNGEAVDIFEWDIPESHEDYTSRGRDCVCSWDEDKESWFSDCPKPERKKSADKDGKHSCNCPNCNK
jgi:hypothetical protein